MEMKLQTFVTGEKITVLRLGWLNRYGMKD
jgi:hypothetical protein